MNPSRPSLDNFFDFVQITATAGKGGDGLVSWRREKFIPKGGPTGGNGGRGGSVYFRTDPNIMTLEHYRNERCFRAKDGGKGGTNSCQGKGGADLILTVPCGTVISCQEQESPLVDLKTDGELFLACRGGKGGLGNEFFKNSIRRTPTFATEGKKGEEKRFFLELKLIADVALIGLPNVGKSTLLNALAGTKAKAADYPFTTLSPNLGVFQHAAARLVIADIPGIIEGAHRNRGLGLTFLRHIERSKVFVYLLDCSLDLPIKEQLALLQNELSLYHQPLLERNGLIAINKIDSLPAAALSSLQEELSSFPLPLFWVSALHHVGIQPLIEAFLQRMTPESINPQNS